MVAEERIRKLQERMAENRIDLAAIGPTTNMRYLLGYAPFADERPWMLLTKAAETVMIVPGYWRSISELLISPGNPCIIMKPVILPGALPAFAANCFQGVIENGSNNCQAFGYRFRAAGQVNNQGRSPDRGYPS